MPQHHHLEPRRYVYTFGGVPPAFHVGDGDTITVATRDARGWDDRRQPLPTTMQPEDRGFHYLTSNPCVGPIHVDGAAVHDVLAVHIEAITLTRDTAWSSQGAGMGSLTGEVPGRKLLLNDPLPNRMFEWQLDLTREVGRLELPDSQIGAVEIPLEPFVGSIGVAPRYGRVETTLAPGEYGGNLDCCETRVGATLYLPVWVPGALLCFGDIHAAQGDGELCRSALETSAEVTLRLEVLRGPTPQWPRLRDADWIMTAGSGRPLLEALQIAQVELLHWLCEEHGYDRQEAWQVNSQAGRMRIGNIVDPQYTVVAKFPRRLLPKAGQASAGEAL
ncbi:MAG: acetamidase/formamidase family protein [Fimbriimonadaceae bacterium]|nr:acetamidase/formamidase family protein [Fimbriimonadaceae bacterium]